MIVTKFGGSSMSDAAHYRKIKEILLSDKRRTVVTVSAPGKRAGDESKVTDLLYTLHAHLCYSVPDSGIWETVRGRFADIENELGLVGAVTNEMDALRKSLSKQTQRSFLVSRGEYFSAKLLAAYLGARFADASELLRFKYDDKLNEEESTALVRAACESDGITVVPGFYGAYPNGDIRLFSRGGSDITGAYLAKFLKAEVYENWTDVSGIYTADPRLARDAHIVKSISYSELRELSYMGASVLHEDSIAPAEDIDIPINIRNTNNPTDEGTLISQAGESDRVITGIAGKKGFMSFLIYKKHMAGEIGFLRRVLEIFENYRVNVEHTPTGMDLLSVVVLGEQGEKPAHRIVSEIEALGASVTIERGISLLAVVGKGMQGRAGVCEKVFGIFGENNINIKLIAQSPDEINIIVGISDGEYEKAICALHKRLADERWI